MTGGIVGVLLAGGNGIRLRPLTVVTNKHMLRVGRFPMIEYPLKKMIQAGITNIHVVTGGENYQGVVKYLGSGSKWDVRISYSIQDEAGGIAQALLLAEPFVNGNKMLVILGDNIFAMDLSEIVSDFASAEADSMATVFCKHSDNPERFGMLKYDRIDDEILAIDVIEKPKEPVSDMILTGMYLYTPDVFDIIRGNKPSDRGELEITDVNRHYIKNSKCNIVKVRGGWTDAGTFETLLMAEQQVKEHI